MSDFYVAKTYTDWVRETPEPYQVNGKMYFKVRSPKGVIKQVRAYTAKEYEKMYGAAVSTITIAESPVIETYAPKVKNILGFQEGYVWIFKGDAQSADYWFSKTPECRYCVMWGWYIVSTDEIPADMPSCIEAVKLPWEKVGNADGTLLPKSIVTKAVEGLIFTDDPSEFQGEIGDRIERKMILTAAIELGETQFGSQRLYCFEDAEKNQYAWKTGVSKDWEIGNEVSLKGTVKEHEIYKGVKRTVLTRVMEGK